ncbi:MAG: hypothetical protein E6Q06_02065 [Candidatus Moraniibacteriota bacterium]|nr:MAG: hypothetical protein E6Q06_02065 [Candidatus Moranbacteria bacterium]
MVLCSLRRGLAGTYLFSPRRWRARLSAIVSQFAEELNHTGFVVELIAESWRQFARLRLVPPRRPLHLIELPRQVRFEAAYQVKGARAELAAVN